MAATKTATKKASAKKATTKKSTAKTATKKSTARKRTTKRVPLHEREPRTLIEDAGYATAGVVNDTVELLRELPSKLQGWRGQATKVAKDAPERVKDLRTEAPAKVESTVKDVRDRVSKDVDVWLKTFEQKFDGKAAEGRKIADELKSDDRVKKVLDQTGNTRSQVKAAFTSVIKTGEVAAEAGKKQVGTATSQAKGAVTSARKTGEAAAEAGKKQASTATTQVKGAATSVRKSAQTVSDAAKDAGSDN
jgi:hypothetical protein